MEKKQVNFLKLLRTDINSLDRVMENDKKNKILLNNVLYIYQEFVRGETIHHKKCSKIMEPLLEILLFPNRNI